MGFTPDDVEPLAYNFGAYSDSEEHLIKEPSDKLVRTFWKCIAKEERVATAAFAATVAPLDGETEAETRTRLEADIEGLEAAQVAISEQSRHRVLVIMSDVCSGDPSVDLLEKLPERYQTGFLAYLRGQLVPKG